MAKSSDWLVYIIAAENGHFYTGITTDIERRLCEHQSKQGGARFFNTSPAKQIVFQEPHPDRSSAAKREADIKKLSRKAKIELIEKR